MIKLERNFWLQHFQDLSSQLEPENFIADVGPLKSSFINIMYSNWPFYHSSSKQQLRTMDVLRDTNPSVFMMP